jgi:transposase
MLAARAKDAAQARRLLAIAAVLDGSSREEAAKVGGMDRQTLRDWVIRFNEQGPDALINIPSPGVPPKLNDEHRAFLARIVEDGPIPAVHGVVRWRACDLIMRLHEEFGLSVSDDTIYRALKALCSSVLPRTRHWCSPGAADLQHRSHAASLSSITTATPGTHSSTSHGRSCSSPAATGLSPVNHLPTVLAWPRVLPDFSETARGLIARS